MLEESGISAEVVDPRTTLPLDKQTLIESAKKTSRAIVIDEGYERYGVTAEMAAVIAEGAFYYLDAPVKRMGAMDVPDAVLAGAGRSDGSDRRDGCRGGDATAVRKTLAHDRRIAVRVDSGTRA